MDRIIILQTRAHVGDYSGFDGDVVAVVEMTPALAKLILSRAKRFKEILEEEKGPEAWNPGKLLEMYFWDHHAEYLKNDDELTQEQNDTLWDGGYLVLPASPYGDDAENTECDQMVFRDDEVAWITIPKHSDVYAITDSIKYADIEQFLKED